MCDFSTLPPAPALPLKGRGNARKPFPFALYRPKYRQLWQAIPASHKGQEATKNKGKNFTWRRVVSPEVFALIKRL